MYFLFMEIIIIILNFMYYVIHACINMIMPLRIYF